MVGNVSESSLFLDAWTTNQALSFRDGRWMVN